MYIYIVLLVLYSLCAINEENHQVVGNRNLYAFFLVLPMWFLVAFRAVTMGVDTINYFGLYLDAQYGGGLHEQKANSNFEIGYVALRYFFVKHGLSFLIFQIVLSSFIYFSLYRAVVKYSTNIALSCFLLLASTKMFSSMNQTRMWIAMSIVLYTIPLIQNRKMIWFLLLLGFAFLFHKSVLIFGVLYPLCILKNNRIVISLIVFGSMAIVFMGASFFGWFTDTIGVYGNYLDNVQFAEDRSIVSASLNLLEYIAFLLFFIKVGLFKISQFKNKKITIRYVYYMIFILMGAFNILGFSNNIMDRVSSYFSIFIIFILPLSLKYVSKNNKMVAIVFIILLYSVEFYVKMKFRPYWYMVTPYELAFTV